MYEVEDVEYERIGERDVARSRPSDWRVTPRYRLTGREIERQEAELYRSFAGEAPREETGPPLDGETPCCVCYENAATRVIVPCGHRCLCYDCAANIALNRSLFYGNRLAKLCPICQAAIAVMPRLC